MLDRYTSTGLKFWLHLPQMESYRNGTGRTVISTHVSPIAACNLKCSYCSVHKRPLKQLLPAETIYEYIEALQHRGLRAAIITGGGEPLLYPHINELISFLSAHELKIGLITNGTQWGKLNDDSCLRLAWARVSINSFPGCREKIVLPRWRFGASCTAGMSLVCDGNNADLLLKLAKWLADAYRPTYVRVLGNCLLTPGQSAAEYEKIEAAVERLADRRFFVQRKVARAPHCDTCHQSYFRPYLHESGYVYPCDSVCLNNAAGEFRPLYALCKASEIADYLDGKIAARFDPHRDCPGCVFTGNVEMLGKWKADGQWRDVSAMQHGDFV